LLLLEKSRKDGGWVGWGAVLFNCSGEKEEIGKGKVDD